MHIFANQLSLCWQQLIDRAWDRGDREFLGSVRMVPGVASILSNVVAGREVVAQGRRRSNGVLLLHSPAEECSHETTVVAAPVEVDVAGVARVLLLLQ